MKSSFGKQFSNLRKEKKLTQERIADQLGVSSQAVSKWENDLSYPDIELLPEIAELLGTSIDELLGTKKDTEIMIVPEQERKHIDELILKIIINSNDGDKVRVNIPVALLKIGIEIGMNPQVTSNHDSLKNINFSEILTMIEKGVIGKLVEIESSDGDCVEIFVE